MNSQLHQCQELWRDYNLDVLPALYATLDEDTFIARPSFCCHHSLVFIISFGSHPAFFLLFLCFLLRSIQIARVAMGKWQNIDLMVSATCVAGSVLSPRLFFCFGFYFLFQHKDAIVLYYSVSPDTQQAELNGGTAKSWSKPRSVSQFKADLTCKNQLQAEKTDGKPNSCASRRFIIMQLHWLTQIHPEFEFQPDPNYVIKNALKNVEKILRDL